MLKHLTIAGAVACLMLPAAATAAPAGSTIVVAQANTAKKKTVTHKPAGKPVTRTTTRGVAHSPGRTTAVKRTTVTGPKGKSATRTTVMTKKPSGKTTVTTTGPRGTAKVVGTTQPKFRPAPNNVKAAAIRGQWHGGARPYHWHGHNYTAWRHGPYRVHYNNGWRTFVAISTLSAIAIAGVSYYPYAYVSAPQNYCAGYTEDGCQLGWASVPTVEGGEAYQCVAYCPWQGD